MTGRSYFAGIAALCATVLVTGGLLAQQEKTHQEMSPEEQAMMAAWEAYMTPGEHHQKLVSKAGNWTIEGRIWHAPGIEGDTFTATAVLKEIMDGRYILENVEGELMGESFHGLGIFGFDNLKQAYVGAWVDNMNTGILRSEGTASGDGKTLNSPTEHPDFQNGAYTKNRIVERQISNDKIVSTFYNRSPDGQEYVHMELTYTRDGESKTEYKKGY